VADVDGDLIGDNLDADKNADGVGDDDNRNGIPDFEEMDLDGDGVPRAKAVPGMPSRSTEGMGRHDGDGIGNNADKDDDGTLDRRAGTTSKDQPLDRQRPVGVMRSSTFADGGTE